MYVTVVTLATVQGALARGWPVLRACLFGLAVASYPAMQEKLRYGESYCFKLCRLAT
jgi:hypothetical protein